MYLIYTDESGTNGHSHAYFSMYGGLVVHESKVLKFEMQIIEIVSEFLGVSNMLETEIHFTEIFNYIFLNKKPSESNKSKLKYFEEKLFPVLQHKTKDDVLKFIDELFQLINKSSVSFIYNYIDKRDQFHQNHFLGHKEISFNAYVFKGFVNSVDLFLTQNNEMGLLIADDFSDQLNRKLKQLSFLELISDDTIKNNPTQKEIIYKRVLAESLVWKNKHLNGSLSTNTIAPLKYKFESNSLNVIDNINFVSSNESIINQMTDVLLFVVRKIKEYDDNKEQYQNIKDLCENDSLKNTIKFLERKSCVIKSQVKTVDNGQNIDLVFSAIEWF